MFPTILTRFVHSSFDRLIIWSFDRLIIWSIWFIWSFDPFDPKIYAVSLFCLCIFFTYSFFLFFMFWFSEEEMEEVRDRFFLPHSFRGQTTTAKLRAKWICFCHQAIFLAHTKIWEFQFILVRLFCLLLLLQKLGSGGSNLTSSMGDSLVWDMGGGPDPGGDPDGPTKVDRNSDGVQHQW